MAKRIRKVFEADAWTVDELDSLIFVDYLDDSGYIHYQSAFDLLQTDRTMTETELYRDYKRLPLNLPDPEREGLG